MLIEGAACCALFVPVPAFRAKLAIETIVS